MKVVGPGRAILLSEPPLYKPHLWFVLTDPDGSSETAVAVMLRTATKFTDTTLLLNTGDHPFVHHESSVHYSTARYFSVASILAAIKTGRCHLREDASPELLERLRKGLLDSPYTVNAIRDHCRRIF